MESPRNDAIYLECPTCNGTITLENDGEHGECPTCATAANNNDTYGGAGMKSSALHVLGAPFRPRSIARLRAEEVAMWLRQEFAAPSPLAVSVEHYATSVVSNGVDGVTMTSLAKHDLVDLGVLNAIHRAKIYIAWHAMVVAENAHRSCGPRPPGEVVAMRSVGRPRTETEDRSSHGCLYCCAGFFILAGAVTSLCFGCFSCFPSQAGHGHRNWPILPACGAGIAAGALLLCRVALTLWWHPSRCQVWAFDAVGLALDFVMVSPGARITDFGNRCFPTPSCEREPGVFLFMPHTFVAMGTVMSTLCMLGDLITRHRATCSVGRTATGDRAAEGLTLKPTAKAQRASSNQPNTNTQHM